MKPFELNFENLVRGNETSEQLSLYPLEQLLSLRKELGRAISISPFDRELRNVEKRLLKAISLIKNREILSRPYKIVEERKLLAPPLKQDPWLYTVEELRRMCGENGLPTDGRKEDLIYRLFKLETPPWAAHPGLVWSPRYHAWLRGNR